MQLDRITPEFGHWFAGFIDGEGCFWISHLTQRRTFHVGLSIHLRADDVAILDRIIKIVGSGSVSVRQRLDTNSPTTVAQLVINSRSGTRTLVEIFDRYPLQTKKARDYKIWREAVMAWDDLPVVRQPGKSGRPRRDWSQIERLHAELKAVRRYA